MRVKKAAPEDALLAAAGLIRLAAMARVAGRGAVVRDRRFEQLVEILEVRADSLGAQVLFQVVEALGSLAYYPPPLLAVLEQQALLVLAATAASGPGSPYDSTFDSDRAGGGG